MTRTCCRTLFIPPAEPEEKLLTENEEQSRRSTLFFFQSYNPDFLYTTNLWAALFLLLDEDCPQSLEMDGRCMSDVCRFHFTSCVCRIKTYTRKYFSSRTHIYWRCFRNKPRSHFFLPSDEKWDVSVWFWVLEPGPRPPRHRERSTDKPIRDSTGINYS